jgi:hypothetical protein
MTSSQIVRGVVVLGVNLIAHILNISQGGATLTSVPLIDSNDNVPPVLECNPTAHMVIGL